MIFFWALDLVGFRVYRVWGSAFRAWVYHFGFGSSGV